MRTQRPPIRVKGTLGPFNNIPDPPFGLTITSLLSSKVSLSWKRQGWRDLQRALRRGERDLDKPVGISYSGKRRWQNSIASNSSDE